MRKLTRAAEPEFLKGKWEKWGSEWEQAKEANRSATFYWHEHEKEPVNRKLLRPLTEQTQNHCSFCDAYPVSPPSTETIEHFYPKAEYPKLAFYWPNLFFCCTYCQQKDGAFSDQVLKPDERDYTFERYFAWDFTTGEICANPLASDQDKVRANATIKYFRLNVCHPALRKRSLRWRAALRTDPIDEFPYRDFVGA